MTNEGNSTLAYSLLQNGLDYILSALENLRGESPTERQLKYAVIHLSAGVELILKERLRLEHWSLIFADSDKATKERFESGDFVSVGFPQLVNRLSSICGVEFDDKDKRVLESLRKMRNCFEHFGIVTSSDAVKSEASMTISIILGFVERELPSLPVPSSEDRLLIDIREVLGEVNTYIEHRWEEIALDQDYCHKPITGCINCGQSASIFTDDGKNLKCLFCGGIEGYNNIEPECPGCGEKLILGDGDPRCECGWTMNATEAAEEYMSRVWGRPPARSFGEGGVEALICPLCEEEALADTGEAGGYSLATVEYICFSCGSKWVEGMINMCDNCGQPYIRTPDDAGCLKCVP